MQRMVKFILYTVWRSLPNTLCIAGIFAIVISSNIATVSQQSSSKDISLPVNHLNPQDFANFKNLRRCSGFMFTQTFSSLCSNSIMLFFFVFIFVLLVFLFHKEQRKSPSSDGLKQTISTHRSAVSTLLYAGCCAVNGAVPRALFMVF